MEPTQNVAFDPSPEEIKAANVVSMIDTNLQRMQYVDFTALGGLLTDDDGEIRRVTATDFASSIGVDRRTLLRWQNDIPDFWEKVHQRRLEITKRTRATKVYNGLFLRAAKGDPAAVRLWAEIFHNYQPPAQKHEVTIGGLVDLAKIAETKKVIDVEPANGD